MRKFFLFIILAVLAGELTAQQEDHGERAGNPVFPGWYADPEVNIYKNQN